MRPLDWPPAHERRVSYEACAALRAALPYRPPVDASRVHALQCQAAGAPIGKRQLANLAAAG